MSFTFPTFRDLVRQIAPPWLQTGYAERFLYAATVQVDALGEALNAGVKLRFPNIYSGESLPLIGRERRIRRGLSEADATYAARLRRWLQDHQRRGGPHAMLAQLRAYFLPLTFPMHLLYRSGGRYVQDPAGTVTRDVVPVVPQSQWARWVLLMYSDDLGALTAEALAVIPREWIAAHCIGEVIVVPAGGELWDYPPERPWDESGTWDTPDVLRVELD